MREVYSITSHTATREAAQEKVHCDKKTYSTELQPGKRVLVRKLSECKGPGKLRSYWEDKVHIVIQRKTPDSPVYEVTGENGKSSKRVLRNLILPCDYLPAEEPVEPAVPDVRPKKPQKLIYSTLGVPSYGDINRVDINIMPHLFSPKAPLTPWRPW